MKRFIFITYLFPPASGAGVHRPLKLVKYIGGYGWQPVVLTARKPAALAQDQKLMDQVPPQVPVVRLLNLEPHSGPGDSGGAGGSGLQSWAAGLPFPDRYILWAASALPGALLAARKAKAQAVVVTAPPFSAFVLGSMVARVMGLPLVLDFRDVWSGFYTRGYRPGHAGRLRRMMISNLEGRLVRCAAAVVTASPTHAEDLRRLHGGPADKFVWLPNGYDLADFSPWPPAIAATDGKFNLLYTGTLFSVTSLRHLWEAMAMLWEDERSRFRVVIAGKCAGGEISDPQLPGLEVVEHGHLDHVEALAQMARAQALVLTLADMPGAWPVIPSKLYEYLAARRPILSLTPPGEASAIVEACRAGVVVAPGEPQKLADVLRSWLLTPPKISGLLPALFDRQKQAGQLAALLERVSA